MTDVSLVNADGVTVFRGTQVGGGGSLPQLVRLTLTAAEVAARWDGGAIASLVEVEGIADTDLIVFAFMYPELNSMDQSTTFSGGLCFYLPGASTIDAYNNGDFVGLQPGSSWNSGTYGVDTTSGFSYRLARTLPGGGVYAQLDGDGPPTTGALTIALGVLRGS